MIGVLLGGCIGTTPEQAAEDALGDTDHRVPQDDGDIETGPRHRPGQPCLVCHSEAHNPGGEIFVIAGTVYERPSSVTGLGGVTVSMTDAEGRAFDALTNPVGTFYVRVEGDLDAPRLRSEGELQLPFTPTFPVRVELSRDADTIEMRSSIQREGSCAGCHERLASDSSPGQIYLLEDVP